jgi:hypothetical protein
MRYNTRQDGGEESHVVIGVEGVPVFLPEHITRSR